MSIENEVGENTNLAGANAIIDDSLQTVVEAKQFEAAADVAIRHMESDSSVGEPSDNPNFDLEKTDVAMNVALEAVGGAAVKTASTFIEVLEDGGHDKFNGQKIAGSIEGKNAQGIEDFIKGGGGKKAAAAVDKPTPAGGSVGRATTRSAAATTTDIMGDKFPPISTEFKKNMMADIETASESINGDNKIAGAKVSEAVTMLRGQSLEQQLARTKSLENAGAAIKHRDQNILPKMGQAQANGLSPGGVAANPNQYQAAQAQTLNLNNRAPSAPNFKDTNISEDAAQA